MPMLTKTEFGMVVAIWGQAWIRDANGHFRPLKVGDAVHKGAVVLTQQDSIVQVAQVDAATEQQPTTAKTAEPADADSVIEALNQGDARSAPAAGLAGGDAGDLTPGYRVERIVELTTPGGQLRSTGLDTALVEAPFDATTEHTLLTQTLPALVVQATEEGPNVGIGLVAPAGATQVRIDGVPTVGQVLLADGTLVSAGSVLSPAQLSGLVYVPPADYLPGTPTGELRFTASTGGINAVGRVDFVVTPVNDAPVANAGSASAAEDTLIPVSLSGTDVDGTVTSVVIDRLPTIGTLLLADGVTPVLLGQTLTAVQAANLVLRPLANQFGDDSIGFTVVDDAGARSTPGTWTVRISAVDDLPVARPDTFTVAEDGSVSINVRFNDGDVETPVLTITHVNGNAVTDGGPAVVVPNGTVQLVAGQLLFTPSANYSGPASFNYTITDGAHTAVAAVDGTVTAIDDLPIASPDSFVVAEDGSVTINVVGNDIDIDGDTLTITHVNGLAVVDGGPAVAVPDGSVRLVSGQLVFTPAPDYNGPASFGYTVSDGTTSVPATVTGTVTPVADAPQAGVPGAQSTGEDTALQFSSANGNALSVADADAGTLTVTVNVTQGTFTLGATAGLLTLIGNGSGSVTFSGSAAAVNAALSGSRYAPTADFNGAASLTLSVNDGTSASANSVAIGVLPVVDITADAVVTAEDTAVAINVLANDTFEGTSPAIVAVNGQAISAGGAAVAVANGSVALNVGGQLVFTPAANYNGAASFSYTVSSGGVSETADVAVNVTPVADVASVSLSATPAVAEGGAIVYTASLDTPALTPVTVALSNGATITIAAGASSGSVALAAPGDDVYIDAGSVAASIGSASGGGFDVLNVDATLATTAITDTVDNTTVSLTASPSVAEGGLITYTASLTAPAQGPVTVNLSNGASITIAAGASSGSVNVAAPGDDVHVDAGSVSTTIASASGGDFENLVVNPAAATTAVSDTLNVTTISLSATPSVAEGGSILYTAALTAPAQTAVNVTLSNGVTITIAAGSNSGSVSVAAPSDDVYIDAGSVSATISSAVGGNFEQLAIDPTAATTAISDTIDTTTVSLSASPAVAEGGAITYTAALPAPAASAVTVTLSNGASIVIAAGASSGQITVPAPGDDVYVDAGSVSATISAASGGNFENLVVNPAPATTTITDTLNTTTVTLTATPSVAEGGFITYTASLTSPAQSAVTVSLSNGATIAIAAGASAGSVNVPAPGDDVYSDAGSVSATISSASGGNFESLLVNPAAATTAISDTIDTTTVVLSATPSVAEGGSIVYRATLTSVATSDVTVTLSNSATITILAGSNSGTVSVAAPGDDVYADATSVSATITSASGGGFENLAVDATPAATTVNDTVDTTTVSLTGAASVVEGGAATYTVSLTSLAATAVTVNLAYSGTAIDGTDFSGVATVMIPAGASSVDFSVATIDDAFFEGTENFTVTLSSVTGGGFENLVVNGGVSSVGTALIDDDATPAIAVSDSAVVEGGFAVFTVSLSGASASAINFMPSLGSGSATIGADTATALEYFDGSAWQSVTAAGVTLAAGSTSVQVRVATTDDAIADSGETFTLTATVVSGATANASAFGTATITDEAVAGPEDTTNLFLSATPSVGEGGSIAYTATLDRAANAPLTVTLSNGAEITIAAGAISGSVSVAAPNDDVYVDAGSVSASISGTIGGAFEYLVVDGTPAVTAVTDTTDNVTIALGATPSVAEGGFITYSATLSHPAGSAVNVTLSNGATFTIAAGATTGTVSVPAPSDDVHVDAGNVSATIASAVGGNFENLVVTGNTATTTITDTPDTTTVTLSATPSVAEGGFITYTATLTSPTQSALTVTLSNGASIVIAANASSGTITVAAPGDDAIVDAGTVSATIAGTSGGNFENLVADPAAATTTVTDTLDTTTISLAASPSVAEGGTITYTATLTALADTAVTVVLSNGATIVIAAGASVGSISVPAPSDDVYVDAGNVSATIASATGGNFENLAIDPAAATTAVTDTLDTTTVSLSATPSVSEGGSITYTATLTAPAQSDVTVTLDDGTQIVIAASTSSASVIVPAPGDDAIVDAGTVTRTIASATGGGFEDLAISATPATTAISDTIDTTTVSLSATPSVAEGGTITYTASLTSAAQTAMTVTLDNGVTINIGAGASTGSITVAAPGDDVYVDAGSVTRSIASASGGNFENLALNATPATTAITDTLNASTVSLSASASVAEGGLITYTASLSAPAQTDVTVTLDDGTPITIVAGASSGSVSVAAPGDDVYVDAGMVTRTIASASGGNFESLQVNPAAAITSISDTLDTTTVSLSATPSVAEGGSIVYTATLTAVAQTNVTVTLDDGTPITIVAGANSGSVSVAAPGDDVHVDAGTVTRNIASATGGNFENLAVNAGPVSTSVTDTIDTTTVSLTGAGSVTEGANASYTLSLTSPAQSAVTLTLAYSGSAADGSDFNGVTTVTIPAGASSANFSVGTLDDALSEGTESFTVNLLTATGGGFENLTIDAGANSVSTTLLDNDGTPSLVVADTAVVEGDSAVFTISLSNASATPITFTPSLASGSATVGVDTATALEWFDGSAWQPVTGAGVTIPAGSLSVQVRVATTDDALADNGETFTLTATVTAGTTANAAASGTATISDEAMPDTVLVSLTGPAAVVEGNTTGNYTVTLGQPAATPVTVSLNYAGTAANGSDYTGVVTLAIPAGASSAAFDLATLDDVIADSGETIVVSLGSISGGGFEAIAADPVNNTVTTTISDEAAPDVTTVSVTATPSVAEGGNITYSATLTNPAHTAVTVNLSNGAQITIVAGASSGTVTVLAPSEDVYLDAGNVSVTIANASGGNFEALAVNPAAAVTSVSDTIGTTTVSLAATPSVAEGGSITYTATLTAPAQTDVTVTLSGGAQITIVAGGSSGSISLPAPGEDVYTDAGSVSRSIVTATGGNFENLVVDGAPAITTVTDTVDTTTVSLTASPNVAEGGSIVYTASLTAPAQTDVTVTISGGTQITILAGSSTGSVSLPAPGEDVYADAGSVSRSIVSATGGGFESLVVDSTAATTSVSDTIDVTTVSLTGSGSVAEGGTASYTVSLTSAAQSDVTVTLAYSGTAANGIDFVGIATVTILAGDSSANFNIATLNDAIAEGSENFTVSLGSASGGNFESLVLSGAGVTTTIADDDTATLSLAATPSLTEAGGNIVYTATLTQPPVSNLLVTLSNGATITINAGATSGTVSVPLVASDDVYVDPTSVSASIAGTSGGGIGLVVDATPAVTTIGDTVDTTTVSLAASPSVAEGGSITYTATLTSAAQTDVTVTISGGAQITIVAGAVSASVSLPAPGDDVYADAGSVSRSITTATGGNFESLVIDPAAATTTVTDTLDTTTVSLSATPTVAEGGQITYTASLTAPAQSDVTVTLSGGTQITILAGNSAGSVNVAAPSDDVYIDAGSVSRSIVGASGGGFENLVVDNTAATTSVSDTVNVTTIGITGSGSVAEGASASYTVSLTSPAQSDVTVTLNYSGTATDGSDFTGIATVTILAGASTATFNVAAIDDALAEGAESFTVAIATATGGGFESLAISGGAGAVTTAIIDDDVASIASVSAASATEANAIVHTVTLTNASTTPTTYSLSLTDGTAAGGGTDYTSTLTNAAFSNGVTISGGIITVPAGVTSFTVTVPTTADAIDEGDETYTLNIGAASGTGTINDDDNAPTITSVSADTQVEGVALVHTVTLSNPSSVATTFAYSLGGGTATGGGVDYAMPPAFSNGVTLSAGVLTVPAGVTSFTITVPTTLDTIDEGASEDYALSVGGVTASGTITDDDNAPTIAGVTSASANEASAIVHTVSLSNASSVATTYALSLSDGTATGGGTDYTGALTNAAFSNGVTISGGVITVPAGVTTFTVTVPTTADTIDEADETYTLSVGSASGTGMIVDDDAAPSIASVTSSTQVEGSALVHTVTLSNASSSATTYAYSLGGGSATGGGVDYTTPPTFSNGVTLSGGVLTVPAGVTSFTVTVPTTFDTIDEGASETYNLNIGGVGAVGTITDDDSAPTISSVSSASAIEAAAIVHTVSLSNASSVATTYTLSLADGTATGSGTDYTSTLTNAAFSNGVTISGGVITVPAGVTTFTVAVPTSADTIDEPNETYSLTVGGTSGTGTITDDDAAPTIASVSAAAQVEGTALVHTVTLTNASSVATTFAYSLGGGSATGGGTDYTTPPTFSSGVTLSGGVLTVPAGVTSFTITVPTTLDTIDEGASETYNLSVGGMAAVGTIVDDDAAPTIASVSSASATEGSGIAHTVSLSNASSVATTFSLSLIDGTASSADYTNALTNAAFSNGVTIAGGVITVPAGVTSFTVTVPTSADTIDEPNETYTLAVGAASGTGTIVDDDAAPTISAVSSATQTEGISLVHTVTLSNASSVATTFAYSLGGGSATGGSVDYTTPPTFSNGVTLAGGVLTVPAGVTSFIVTVPTTLDTIDEGASETYNLSVGGVSAVGTITDDDNAPTISSVSSASAIEATSIVHTVSLSNASSVATTYTLSLTDGSATGGGTDYTSTLTNAAFSNGVTIAGGVITVPTGVTSFTVTVATTADTIDEPNETYTLSVGAASGTGTITDNDAAPAVATVGAATQVEGTALVHTVTLSNASSVATTFAYSLGGGSATGGGTDYTTPPTFSNGVTLAGGVLTVPAGVTSFTITVPTTLDTIDEGASETYNLSVGGVAAVGTIVDDDNAPTISTVSSAGATEAGAIVHTVSLNNASSVATTYALSLSDGTATGGGTDYTSALTNTAFSNGVTIAGGVITVPAGVTSFTVSVPTSSDALDEANETYSLTVGGVSGTGTITDDDPTPSLAINDVSVNEAAGTATFTVTLSAASGQTVTVNYGTANGSATAGSDFGGAGGTLTFAPGVTSQTITINITNDTVFEGNETFNVTLSGATNATLFDATGTGTIVDNDAAPTIASVSSPTAVEGSNLVYSVNLSNASASATTFAFSLGGGSAAAADFGSATFSNGVTLAGGVLTVPAGVTAFTVTLPTVQDALDEPSETVPVTVGGITGTGTITDDDPTPSLTVNDVSVNEAAGTATFTVTLSAASGQTVTVGYNTSNGSATAGSDYTAVSGTLTFAPGATTQTITVPIGNDTLFEGNETFNVNLVSPTNASIADALGIGTIVDNDLAPTVSSVSSPTAVEGANLVYTVNLSNASSTATTFPFALGGGSAAAADYGSATFSNGVTLAAGVLNVPAGVTSFTVTLPTVQDTLDEINETVPVSVGGVTGIGTITDDDPTPSLAVNDVSINEAAGTATFTVTLSAASGQSVTVNYGTSNGTASAGSDYTGVSGTLTFAPGVTSQTITVPITNDTVDEPNETFYVNLSTPTNAVISDALGVGTIVDNDAAPTVASVSAASATEGGNLVHTVTLSNASSTPISLAYSLGGGSATADTDFAATPTFSNGVTLSGGVLTVPAGVTSFTVTVASIDDTIDEPAETYSLTVGGVGGTGTINDNDAAPTLTVSNVTVAENAGYAVFSVGLSNPSSGAISLGLSFVNGSAVGGGSASNNTDYGNNTRMEVSTDGGATWSALGTNTATIAAGQTGVLVRTNIYDNSGGSSGDAATETFTLTANVTAGTTSNASATGTGTIVDQNVTVSSPTVAEGGNLVYNVTVAGSSTVSYPFVLGGSASASDYGPPVFSNGVTLVGGVLTVPNGVNFTITIPTINDVLDEPNETVTVTIGGVTGTGTITDNDDTPSLAINDVTVNEAAGTATFTVTLSAASGQTVTVGYTMTGQTALPGSDYTAGTGTLTFAPGTTTQTITVPILQDDLFEGAETFRVDLGTATNASISDAVGIGTIRDDGTGSGGTDNDAPTLAVSSLTVSDQSAGFAVFVVSLSNPSASATGVSLALTGVTATSGGVDFGAAGATNLQVSTDNGATWSNATSATIAPNNTYLLVRTPISADALNEVSETFTLTATRTSGTTLNASAVGTATITDVNNAPNAVDDAPLSNLREDTANTVLAGHAILGGSGNNADVDPNTDTLAITGAVAGNGAVTAAVPLAAPLSVNGQYGTLLIQADGTYTYTLDNSRIQTQNLIGGQSYVDLFTYRITDGNGGYDTATISVSVMGSIDLTAITPVPVAITADGLTGEYYGYNDTVVAGNRVHADDRSATSLGTGTNLESVEDVELIINGRNAAMGGPADIVGTANAAATNAADVLFNVRTLNYGTTPVVSSNLGDNAAVAAGNPLPPQDNISGSGTSTALANFLDQDSSTAVVQTGTPTGTTVGTQTGLGATTDAIIRMSGYAYLERGNYDFRVTADDGFRLKVGGETLLEFDGNQPPTTRTYNNVEVSDLISGLTSIELLYWEQGGNANLQFEFKLSDSNTWIPFSLDSIAFFSAANVPTLTDTRIQDVVESATNQQHLLRTGSVLDGDSAGNTLTGNAGRDYVQGFGGNDVLNGFGGADFLDGGDGDDTLDGGDGNDILIGGTGNDIMIGGKGDDIYRIDSAGDIVVEAAGPGEGTDTVEIEAGYAVGTYTAQANIENVLLHGSLNSNVTGNAADNRITGNDGNNVLSGGAGDDRILGGRGNDTLTGGADKDIFEWNLADRGTPGAPAVDTITDFTYGGSTTSSVVPSGDLTSQRTDVLDLRDLLVGEHSSSVVIGGVPVEGNLQNYIDVAVSGGNTTLRISSTGGFSGGSYVAGAEDQRIVLTGVDLYAATGVSAGNEAELLRRMLSNGTLVVD